MNSKLSFGVIATLIAVIALGVAIFKGGTETIVREVSNLGGGTRFINGLSTDSTSPSAGQVRTTSLTVTAASTLTGTTSPAQVLLPVGSAISTAATGTPITLYSNTTGPKVCRGSTGVLSARNRGNFSPSIQVSIGTSSASVTTTNLVASTTIATSTPGTSFFRTISFSDRPFILEQGDEIMAITGDITNTEASSTNYTNLTLDARILCSELEI